MAHPIVLNFFPDGTVEYTRSAVLNDLWEGAGEMVRVSDIQKSADTNLYHIHWLQGPHADKDHTSGMDWEYGLDADVPRIDTVLQFSSYEEAVSHEVRVLNAMRRAGISFNLSKK